MITTDVRGAVRTVTLDRPDRRNALTSEGLDELQAAIDDATEPVLYLCGEGEAFCAGADLDTVRSLDEESAAAFAERGQTVAHALANYDGAVVAGVDGPARGGGVELALACDLRVATPAATFAENGVSLGLFGAWGGTARLPRVVGEGVALDIALSGRVLDAEEAYDHGLCSRVTERPRRVADSLAENDPTAMRRIKERIRDTGAVEDQQRRERAAFTELIGALDDGS
ncbi:enoyl-CoA hydratase/isomerase family protein [Halovenus sp. WSH3]|uniref:Enoyl-CoA hydratase/isomerase family protein n=1 Tax=Halovenus carboxidivorans TaxID=2692199 RepID=A0A6B0TGQ4_9EURY|nr:enoyl-CoA hydratase/isomerase family protein [Halovenus carboxidivorans]MXR52369.1 enoyl-CoA hydratase/isomerase family protein [Halovenus carboxidivorans]